MYFTTRIAIDAGEFYSELDDYEKSNILTWLMEDGFFPDEDPSMSTYIDDIKERIYRLKYRGLDSEKTTVEILEEILEKAENL